jgi:hypothetical protein
MKYHPLSIENLETNVEMFKAFLSTEGIDALTWADIKKNDGDRLEKLVNSFSHIFFESLIEKGSYFSYLNEYEFQLIHFRKNDFEMIVFKSDSPIKLQTSDELKGEIIYQTKSYLKTREVTISLYYHLGFRHTTKELFHHFCLAYAESKSYTA